MNGKRICEAMYSFAYIAHACKCLSASRLGQRTESSAQDAILRRMKDIPLMNESFTNLTFTKAGVEGVEQSGYQALSFADFSIGAESLSHP